MYTNMQHFVARAEKELTLANGQRRQRICNMGDVVLAILQALNDGEGFRNGGEVSHAYKYPAETTHIYAKDCDRSVYATDGYGILVVIGTSDAREGRTRKDGTQIRMSKKVAMQLRDNALEFAREAAQRGQYTLLRYIEKAQEAA